MQSLTASRTPVLVVHSEDDSVIPVEASDEMVRALQAAHHPATRYMRYKHAPGPPMEEYADLVGHGSYEIAFRDQATYAWLLSHTCETCRGPSTEAGREFTRR